MVYHDMAYASDAGKTHGPIATPTQHAELRHQIRRLSHHPAIVLWDGNNEVPVNMWQPSGVFASFVMTVVAQEDQSRAVWPSSPSRGWQQACIASIRRQTGTRRKAFSHRVAGIPGRAVLSRTRLTRPEERMASRL